jgi:hypothetical protein
LVFENANNIKALYDKQYNIDELQDQLMKRIQTGNSLASDIETYIATKDDNVNAINTMMDKAKEYVKGLDMADPTVKQNMANYTNYLTILKGRQQKRYTDFAKQSTDLYKAETDQLKDLYDTNLQTVKDGLDSFSNDQKQATDVYNKMDKMLQDLYDNVNSREENEMKKQITYSNMIKADADAAKTVLQNNADTAGYYTEQDRKDAMAMLEGTSSINSPTVVGDPTGTATSKVSIMDGNIKQMIEYAMSQHVGTSESSR